jgi:hypothetical protein
MGGSRARAAQSTLRVGLYPDRSKLGLSKEVAAATFRGLLSSHREA